MVGGLRKKAVVTVNARGHRMITATHPTTLMITREEEIGPTADCVVAVAADKAVADLDAVVKESIRAGAPLEVVLEVEGMREKVLGRGDKGLSLSDKKDMVIRRSDYKCGRTLMIGADKSAAELSRKFVRKLRDPEAKVKIFIRVLE